MRLLAQPSGLATQPSPESVAASKLSIQNIRLESLVKGNPKMELARVWVRAQLPVPSLLTTQVSVVPTCSSTALAK